MQDFIILPEIINTGDTELSLFIKKEKEKGQYLNYPHVCLLAEEENDFWSSIIEEAVKECSCFSENYRRKVDLFIYNRVHLLLKQEKINFYCAFKYFWNRLAYYKAMSIHDIYSYDYFKISFINILPFSRDEIGPPFIHLSSRVLNIPSILIPNLVGFLYENFQRSKNYGLMYKNNFNDLSKYPYPKTWSIPHRKFKNKKLVEEYMDRKSSKDDFINSSVLLELVRILNPEQKKQFYEYLRTL